MKKLLLLCGMLLMLNGCMGNGFANFYQGQTFEQVQASGFMKTCAFPSVQELPDDSPDSVITKMFTDGFTPIGTSTWNGPANEGDQEAIEQGQRVGACIVLWKADYANTRQGNMPMSIYTPGGVSTTTHTGTVYSGGASGMYSGTSTTYDPGTVRTEYIPYSVDRYNYTAVYFARIVNNPAALMINVAAPPDVYMRATDSRSGMLVTRVMKDGNAYKANIFPGDIIMSINGQPTSMEISSASLMNPGVNELKIWRDGRIVTKTVTIPE